VNVVKPDTIPLLKGKEAKNFEKYRSRVPTEEELEYTKKADEFYRDHCPAQTTKKTTK
jgi:hypothetical protein